MEQHECLKNLDETGRCKICKCNMIVIFNMLKEENEKIKKENQRLMKKLKIAKNNSDYYFLQSLK